MDDVVGLALVPVTVAGIAVVVVVWWTASVVYGGYRLVHDFVDSHCETG
jgi:hypothetical protein